MSAQDVGDYYPEPEEARNLPAVIDAEFHDLAIVRAPDIVVEEARKAALVLNDVIGQKTKKVMFGGQQYLTFDDWQTVARFYGVAVRIAETRFITLDVGNGEIVAGWEAIAEAVTADGRIASRAEAMCMNDEEKWSSRPKYAYVYCLKDGGTSVEDPGPGNIVWIPNPNNPGKKMPKKEKQLVGEERVPQYQLRSMAATRACAKVLRQLFSWVVVLAGYQPTPAEEIADMPGVTVVDHEEDRGADKEAPTARKAATAPPTQSQGHSQQRQGNGNGERKPDAKAKVIGEILALAREHATNGIEELLEIWSDYEKTDGSGRAHMSTAAELEQVGEAWLRKTKLAGQKWVAMGMCPHCKAQREPGED